MDPVELLPMIYLQNARLMLHRHNLNPICDTDARSTAIDDCANDARDTAKLLRRCMQEPSAGSHSPTTAQNDTWEERMVSAVTAFFCTHIWRCTLFLCFRFDFESALTCARASATVGDARPINISCGRYIEFFLREMVANLDLGNQLDRDEEMIAYVSGDLQGSFESSWIWQESNGRVHLQKPLQSWNGEPKGGQAGQDFATASAQKEEFEWGGWEKVVRVLEELVKEKQDEHRRISRQETSRPTTGELPQLATSPLSVNVHSGSNRMSIRDLI